jgi:hypothetical protein
MTTLAPSSSFIGRLSFLGRHQLYATIFLIAMVVGAIFCLVKSVVVFDVSFPAPIINGDSFTIFTPTGNPFFSYIF